MLSVNHAFNNSCRADKGNIDFKVYSGLSSKADRRFLFAHFTAPLNIYFRYWFQNFYGSQWFQYLNPSLDNPIEWIYNTYL